MDATNDVSKCAHPQCSHKFARLGDGELFVFPVHDPKAWGLSADTKQKVFWLCTTCCLKYRVRLDRRHQAAQLVRRAEVSRHAA